MNELIDVLKTAEPTFFMWFIPSFFAFWFFPTILALFFNRKALKYIAIVNIPAGMSFLLWGALILFAVTGNLQEKYIPKRWRREAAAE